jgi:hypothetical protein
VLDAVAVMNVDVDIGDAAGAPVEQPADRDRRVVVDAEARRPVRHGVMQAAGDVDRVLGLAAPHHLGGLLRSARDQR